MIRRPNALLIALIIIIVVVEIIVLRPSSVETGEEATTQGMFSSIEAMVQAQKYKDEIGYTIDDFHYAAVENEQKTWEMVAVQAVLYEKSRVVRASRARIKMFDSAGKITFIEGDEAQYQMGNKDLALQGHVKVTFPDGFWLRTERAFYSSISGVIRSDDPVYGEAMPSKGEMMKMWGKGFEAHRSGPDVNIFSQAHVMSRRTDSGEVSDVRSDRAKIDRYKKVATFWMDQPQKFVESMQGTLHVRSRRQEAIYDSDVSAIRYMTAYDDVLIRETDTVKGKKGLKYATSQKAEFFTAEDKILLSGFPSAYQERDTLTGELITIYRKLNLVEVSHANAYHQ